MKRWVGSLFLAAATLESSALLATAGTVSPPPQYMSTVQIAVHESTPEMTTRSEKLVIQQMTKTFESWPELSKQRFDIRSAGNEIILSLISTTDMRVPMQRGLVAMIQELNGLVRARGVYRASVAQPLGGYLEVVLDDNHRKIYSIAAQSVPFRDVLKEMKSQLGHMSYLIPGDCADMPVDWSFGEQPHRSAESKTVESALEELATVFNLKLKIDQKTGTYIFSGACGSFPMAKRFGPSELLTTSLFIEPPTPPAGPGAPVPHRTQVYFPLLPLGD